MNLAVNTFNDASPSYFHKSIGGYHGAKMLRYQELIETQISKNNQEVLNMLNTKYFIIPDRKQNGKPVVQLNSGALGNSWFVSSITGVNSADEEVAFLNDFDASSEAVYNGKYFSDYFEGYSLKFDSSANIRQTQYGPKHMVYQANVPGSSEQFAVFSEIYYNTGKNEWQVYIDGEESSHVRVNYVLRGMKIPPGEHTIEFKFVPKTYYAGSRISLIASLILLVMFCSIIGFEVWSRRKEEDKAEA